MEYEIIHLRKSQWKGHVLPMGYKTEEYYEVSVDRSENGFAMKMEKKRAEPPIVHTPEEYDFPDKLYEDWWTNACAWGVLINEKLVAAIETDLEKWSNRLRITELWVAPEYQKKGIGRALMETAKEQARLMRSRAVILETQSCNINAIGFYLHEGFTLIGFDSCCYSNRDIERKEVRIELGWFPEKRTKLSKGEVEIRQEKPEDYMAVEQMTQEAFWNKYKKGCDEHYLVHKLRNHPDYLSELSRIAVVEGEVAGAVFYSKSKVKSEDSEWDVLTFGPLCVRPDFQGRGIGEMLLKETMQLAKEAEYPGIVIFGEPDYYPRAGFRTCDAFGITTADGRNFDAFLGIELKEGAMKGICGRFYESEVFESLALEKVEAYSKRFPEKKKQYFPCQWSKEE